MRTNCEGTTDFSTPATRDEVATLQRFIEHAPRDPGPLSPEIRGWWTPLGNYVCARCAGRIMARGCNLPGGSEPAWQDYSPGHSTVRGVCCLCE